MPDPRMRYALFSVAVVALALLTLAPSAQAQHCNRHIYNNSSEDIRVRIVKSEVDWEGTVAARAALPIEYHNDVKGFMIARNVGGTMEWEERVWPFTGFSGETETTLNFLENAAGKLPGKVGAAAKAGAKLNLTWLVVREIFGKPDCYWIHEGRVDSDVYGVVFNDPADGDILVINKPSAPAPAPTAVTETMAATGTIPAWEFPPSFATTALNAGFSDDPWTDEISGGGTIRNPLSGPGCVVSWIGQKPDYVVMYAAGSYPLTFSAASNEGDLTLVVRAPNGTYYCDDDSGGGRNPRVHIGSPGSGEYRVWVGLFGDEPDRVPAVLGVSEVGNLAQ